MRVDVLELFCYSLGYAVQCAECQIFFPEDGFDGLLFFDKGEVEEEFLEPQQFARFALTLLRVGGTLDEAVADQRLASAGSA